MSLNTRRRRNVPYLIMVFIAALFLCSYHLLVSNAAGPSEPQRSRSRRPPNRTRKPAQPRVDYSQFSHTTHVEKQKLACDSCHKFPTKNWKELRKGDAGFQDVGDFPEHAACLNCHRQQFFARERPAPVICSNCHIAVTPRDTARWLFPSLGDLTDPKLKRREAASEFAVGFPHDKHLEVVGFNPTRRQRAVPFSNVSFRVRTEDAPKSCAICHQTYQPQGNSSDEYLTKPPKNLNDAFWLKKGTFKTIPNSHATCFTCHNPDSGIPPESKDCNGCHKLRGPEPKPRVDFDPALPALMGVTDRTVLRAWSRRMSSGAFRHEGGAHPDVSCTDCHNVTAMSTLVPKTTRVPTRSCGGTEGCHATATTDEGGALNFEIDERKKDSKFVCTKCHITFGRDALPEDHLKALPTPTPAKKPGLAID
jgi:hypothetical protein